MMSPTDAKVPLTMVQPQQRIRGAIKLWKLDLVRCLEGLTIEIILRVLAPMAVGGGELADGHDH
jgi:hypothetical protein